MPSERPVADAIRPRSDATRTMERMRRPEVPPALPDPDGAGTGPGSIWLPYEPRPGQLALALAARKAFVEGRQAVLEAGTGTGKTVAVLAAALEAAALTNRRVVYLTRTNSQAKQVLHEFRKLTQHPASPHARMPHLDGQGHGRPLALALQGRTHLCPELRDDPRFRGATSEEIGRICGGLKRRTLRHHGQVPWGIHPRHDGELPVDLEEDGQTDGEPGEQPRHPAHGAPHAHGARQIGTALPVVDQSQGCRYYSGLLQTDPDDLLRELIEDPVDAEILSARLEKRGVCPYEATKGLMAEARLLVLPYIYVADPRLRRALTDWIMAPLAECVVVIDEAHNLPEYLRSLHSPELSLVSLERAAVEAVEMSDPEVRDGVPATHFVHLVEKCLIEIVADRVLDGEDDGLVPPDELTVYLLTALRASTRGLVEIIDALHTLGDRVRDAMLQAGKLPRSYLGALGSFIASWINASASEHVHVALGGDDARLVLYCLDPSIGAGFLEEAYGAVHISGTLRPLDQYRDLLALSSETDLRSIPSPFPREHLRIVLVDDVTTRYQDRQRDPAMMDRLHDHLQSIAATPGLNSALFFSSHQMADEAREFGLGAARRTFREASGMGQGELMAALDLFRQEGERTRSGGPGATWLGVMGGRVSEGMDFPGAALECAVLIGVPYPKPTARQRALVRFNEIRFDRGWEYAVEAPTLRKVLQAMGRVIRDANDTGVVFLLDARFRKFAHELQRLERLPEDQTCGEFLADWVRAREAA